MPRPPTDQELVNQATAALEHAIQSGERFPKKAATEQLGINRSTFDHRIRLAQTTHDPERPLLPDLPDDDLDVEEIIEWQTRRFEKRIAHIESRKWASIKMPDDKPFGVLLMGDPHVDDNFCNWSLLRHHCDIAKNTEGMYGANVGDTENRWVGRLMALWAQQDTSEGSAWKLAEWLFLESGVQWLVWILGNHDVWRDGADRWKLVNRPQRVLLADWGAQFKLVSTNGTEFKIWMSHDFPGRSVYNSLHGPQRAAHMKEDADLYIAGHTHNWALHQEESASRGFVYWLARARGYKWHDDHALKFGHQPQQEGASIVSIFNPRSDSMAGRVQCFSDVEVGADFLTWLRRKSG